MIYITEEDKQKLNEILSYLEKTEEDSWCEDVVKSKDGKNCLYGHLFDMGGSKLFEYFEGIASTYAVFPVNDGNNPKYQQPTPKQRCIAYIKDLRDGKAKTTLQEMDEFVERLSAKET